MPSYFVDGQVVDIDASTKIAAKRALRGVMAIEYVAELHKVDTEFYEKDVEGNKVSLVTDPHEWLEGLNLDDDEVERVRQAFT